jgi:hypothetical protein
MNDYTWPSIYFSYFFFALCLALALFFFIRSFRDGYWGERAEEAKWRVFEDERAFEDDNPDAETRRRREPRE